MMNDVFENYNSIKEAKGIEDANEYLQFAVDMMLRRNGHKI